jgi:hypothetical protein
MQLLPAVVLYLCVGIGCMTAFLPPITRNYDLTLGQILSLVFIIPVLWPIMFLGEWAGWWEIQ